MCLQVSLDKLLLYAFHHQLPGLLLFSKEHNLYTAL